jgi:hypothetical protein
MNMTQENKIKRFRKVPKIGPGRWSNSSFSAVLSDICNEVGKAVSLRPKRFAIDFDKTFRSTSLWITLWVRP